MNVPKRHHFVPRWYIDRFVDAEGFVYVVDLKSQKIWRPKPDNVFVRKHYYKQDWAPEGIDPNIFETTLSTVIEGPGRLAIEELTKEPPSATTENIGMAAVYLVMQRIRVPHRLRIARAIAELALRDLKADPRLSALIKKSNLEIKINDTVRFPYMLLMLGHTNIFQYILGMQWSVYKAPEQSYFITTDDPVSFFNFKIPPPDEAGIGLAGTMVLFPLSPYHLLELRHPGLNNGMGLTDTILPNNYDHEYTSFRAGLRVDKDYVDLVNKTLIELAHKQAIAKSRIQLENLYASLNMKESAGK